MSNLNELPFASVADIMSGTASLAYAMKRAGKKVIANDYLGFNYQTAKAFIENPGTRLDADDIRALLCRQANVEYQTFVETSFEGMYFTADENRWLDQTVANIEALGARGTDSQDALYKAALAQHALIQAALAKRPFNLFHRKNLYLREAEVPRRFGNKTTWDTPFPELFTRFLHEANECVFDNEQDNLALNYDAANIPELGADLVYIDPPYFAPKRERVRSNYRVLYHFAEGLARYHEWPSLIDETHPLKALRPACHSTDVLFTCPVAQIEKSYLDWLKAILGRWPNSLVAMSYKHPGTPSINLLRELLIESGRTVQLRAAPYTYALSKKNGKPKENIEVLLIGS